MHFDSYHTIVYFDDALYLFFYNTELCKNQVEFSSLVVY